MNFNNDKSSSRLKDLTGLKFGRLKVIKLGKKEKRKSGSTRIYWICECECGNIKEIESSFIKNGRTSSCGCIKSEMMKNKMTGRIPSNLADLTGKRFNSITVIERAENDKKGKVCWLCLCDCGNFRIIQSGRLPTVKTCGCSKESFVAKEVKKYFSHRYNSFSEYKALINPKTDYFLPFDIYVPQYKLFVEINGIQHYEFTKYWHIDEKGFKKQRYKDNLKKKYAKENGFYIEIDLRKIKTSEEAIEKIEKFIEEISIKG